MDCTNARALIPSYLDGELSQAQAGPLRQHLLDCQACRASAQDQKNLEHWFVPTAEIAVPRDFAARVARRAFQGDTGEGFEIAGGAVALREAESGGRLLRFVLSCTAVAAGLLLMLALGVRHLGLPQSSRLVADDKAPVRLAPALEALDRLNQADKLEAARRAHPAAENGAQGGARKP